MRKRLNESHVSRADRAIILGSQGQSLTSGLKELSEYLLLHCAHLFGVQVIAALNIPKEVIRPANLFKGMTTLRARYIEGDFPMSTGLAADSH